VLHDIINNKFAHKAIEKGADGLIAVAAGAGGHAGTKSPFALIQEIRQWFDGPLALSGSIATGDAVLAAQAMGADFAYIGSAFIATHEARASDAYKQAIVDGNSDDIVYSNLFTGVHGNYLAPSIRAAGMDPDNLPESDPSKMNFGGDAKKAWKDIWGCGQGIGAIRAVACPSRGENSSVFSRPKKPSQTALPSEHPVRDIERSSFAFSIRDSDPGERRSTPRSEWTTSRSLPCAAVSSAASSSYS
jgi:NAD(P)H-dependent flavin oxidoreductase YrpB (nitropropane dioxygenase family)